MRRISLPTTEETGKEMAISNTQAFPIEVVYPLNGKEIPIEVLDPGMSRTYVAKEIDTGFAKEVHWSVKS